jgi:hypothetical protein
MRFKRGKISLKDFSVCNGCQSLLSLWENRSKLTDSLEILVRIVRVGQDRQIAEQIAYRTNNQNPISLRDLSSNDTAQVHLKNAFDRLFSSFAVYGIKRGEPGGGNEIINEEAGRLILALYVKEPWSAHQKYRVFGDLESRIFDYELQPEQIRLAQLLSQVVSEEAKSLNYERIAKYGLSHYILVYLIGEVLRLGVDGKALLKNPLPCLIVYAVSFCVLALRRVGFLRMKPRGEEVGDEFGQVGAALSFAHHLRAVHRHHRRAFPHYTAGDLAQCWLLPPA